MTKQSEFAAQLGELVAQVNKIGTETQGLQTKVSELEELLQNSDNISQEVLDKFNELKASVQSVDDLVADAPVDPTTDDSEG